jgi:cobalt-precorrin-5B (C1)-methyltransferase
MPDPVIDPVSGLKVPQSWIERSGDARAAEKIKSGRWVMLSDGRMLRRGLTTGTTAAAACKGAIISRHTSVDAVEVPTPVGLRVSLPVIAQGGVCVAVKDAGDHQSDITAGLEIVARASPSADVQLCPGEGIGSLGRGLARAAISRSAREQIIQAIQEGLDLIGLKGVHIDLSVPAGREASRRTLNPSLGIEGGISILGSTGFVEPWNEHLGRSRAEELEEKKVVATTGRLGLRFSRVLFPDHKAVLIGSQLDRLSFEEGQESILCGLPALILRWASPRILEGTGYTTVAEMVEREPHHQSISRALEMAKARLPYTRIVLLHRDGRVFVDLP